MLSNHQIFFDIQNLLSATRRCAKGIRPDQHARILFLIKPFGKFMREESRFLLQFFSLRRLREIAHPIEVSFSMLETQAFRVEHQ